MLIVCDVYFTTTETRPQHQEDVGRAALHLDLHLESALSPVAGFLP